MSTAPLLAAVMCVGLFPFQVATVAGEKGRSPVFRVGQEIEAETGALAKPMQVGSLGADNFVHVPAGSANFTGALAQYRIRILETGDYHIWSRVYATSASDDSFLVRVLDPAGHPVGVGEETWAHFRLEFCDPGYLHGAFAWTRVGHHNTYAAPEQIINPILYHMAPGIHTIQFAPRELGTRLDKLRVERFCPDSDGDGRSVCAGDCDDSNPGVHPGREEACSDSIDDDCDGQIDEGCGGGVPDSLDRAR